MQAPPLPRILAAILALLALGGVLVALVAPWGGYEADGQFSASGCSGDIAVSTYHLRHATRTLQASDDGFDCPTTIIVRFAELADDPSQVTQQRNPGASEMSQAFPLIVTGAALGLVALAFAAFALDRGTPWTFLAAGVALLALLGILGGTVLYQLGAAEQIAWEKDAIQGDLRADPDAWSWGAGLFAGYGSAVLFLGAAVLGFVPTRASAAPAEQARDEGRSRVERSEEELEAEEAAERLALAKQEARRIAAAAEDTRAEGVGKEGAPAERAIERGPPRGPGAAPRPSGEPRRLKCPECDHRFVGAWGQVPVCPACGFSKGA